MTSSGWGEDEDYPRDEWQADVANEDTQLGYWDWVEHNKESAEIDEEGLSE